ncbi:MAG: glycosyltransferase N-terminal domain-containing protein [Mucinivorans sp.]
MYRLALALFDGLIWFAATCLGNRKAQQLRAGRRGLLKRIECSGVAEPFHGRCYWVHCASLGEFEQGRPLIEAIKAAEPTSRVVLTFFSPSGYELQRGYPQADYVFYLPSDTKSNAQRFVAALQADVAIFVKYEYWYNYLHELRSSGAKSYVVSAIFRPNMVFFKPWGGFFRQMLLLIDCFFVQNSASKELLSTIKIKSNVVVSGDTRFDRVVSIVHSAPCSEHVARFTESHFTMICGSTWGEDERLLVELMKLYPEVRFVVAPHEIHEGDIDRLITQSSRRAMRYTQLEQGVIFDDEASLLVVDCVGLLSGLYQYGSVAYIGGGFGVGIHNILEAATWGMPVIFGPKYSKFSEAVELIRRGGAFSIANIEQLQAVFVQLQENMAIAGEQCSDYVQSQTGATQIILNSITAR